MVFLGQNVLTPAGEPGMVLAISSRVQPARGDIPESVGRTVTVKLDGGGSVDLLPDDVVPLGGTPLASLVAYAGEGELALARAAKTAGRGPVGLALNLAKSEVTKVRGLLLVADSGGAAEGS